MDHMIWFIYQMNHMESRDIKPYRLGRCVVQAPYELNLTDQQGTSKLKK